MVAFNTLLRGATSYLASTAVTTHNYVTCNIPTWIDSAGATAHDLDLQDTGTYILGAVGKGLETTGNEAGVIFNGAINGIQTFDSEAAKAGMVDVAIKGFQTLSTTSAPAWLMAGKESNKFRKMHSIATGVSIATLVPGLYIAGTHLADISAILLNEALTALTDVSNEKSLPVFDEAGNWLYDHRVRIAVIVGLGVVILYPGLVTTPILWALGFTSVGIKAGKCLCFHLRTCLMTSTLR